MLAGPARAGAIRRARAIFFKPTNLEYPVRVPRTLTIGLKRSREDTPIIRIAPEELQTKVRVFDYFISFK
jgi:hypothetical protein